MVTSAVRARRRSSSALVATVEPCTKCVTSPGSTPARSSTSRAAATTPSSWPAVLSTLAVTMRSAETSTASVNVPPTSMPERTHIGGRRLFAEPHRVVGAAVLGIDLRGVGQDEPRHGRLQRRDALVVPDGDDRLRGRLAVQPAVDHPRAIEGRVHLAQAGQVALEQLVGVEAEQLVAVLEVVGHVEEAAAVVALGLDEVRVLDQPDERQVAIGHVGPVEVAERPVELEQQAERGEVLDRRLGEAGELREDVVRDGGDHAVVALARRPARSARGSWPARKEPGAP